MKRGRYEKKSSGKGAIIAIVVLLIIILLSVVAIVILLSRQGDSANVPETTEPETSAVETTLPPTEPPTEASTQAPTEETTEPLTEPPTEETTEPPTEEPTEEATEATAPPATPEQKTRGEKVAAVAAEAVGKEFMLGGNGPDAFDTSGLVYYCFQENDISVPRTVSTQAEYGTLVDKEDLLPGDVVFFWTDTPGEAQYVGIYIGDDTFVAARNEKYPVSEMDLSNSYFEEHFVFARRYGD